MKHEGFTPRPWKIALIGPKKQSLLHAEDGSLIAVTSMEQGEREKSNARLIADAPNLLAERDRLASLNRELVDACQAFVTAYEKSCQLEKTDVAVRMARAALAKAKEQMP